MSDKSSTQNLNVFRNHGGKIVAGFVGIVGGWMLKKSIDSAKLQDLINEIENSSPVSPEEIEELRWRNDFSSSLFDHILDFSFNHKFDGKLSYPALISTVSTFLPHPVLQGNILDRVIFQRRSETHLEQDRNLSCNEIFIDKEYFLICISMMFNTSVADRHKQLWKLLRSNDESTFVTVNQLANLVDKLKASYQVPSSRLLMKKDMKWPFQDYALCSGFIQLSFTKRYQFVRKQVAIW